MVRNKTYNKMFAELQDKIQDLEIQNRRLLGYIDYKEEELEKCRRIIKEQAEKIAGLSNGRKKKVRSQKVLPGKQGKN